jgi:hypothetical protein
VLNVCSCAFIQALDILGFTAHVLWYLGYPDRALETMREALSIAAKLTDPIVQQSHAARWRDRKRGPGIL